MSKHQRLDRYSRTLGCSTHLSKIILASGIATGLTSFAAAPAFAQQAPVPSATQDAPAADASQDAPAAAQNVEDRRADIVVTGSRIPRRDYQSSSPIVTVGQESLSSAGQPTLDRAIGQLPQFSAAQGLSQVGDVQARTGFVGGQAYGDLRGLGPNRSLILMDGRRLVASNPNGTIDLNTIPMVMIENVEIITGGASATYGSDAIAGVVNFRLRRNFSGVQISGRHGGTTQGDGATNQLTALIGGNFADGRGNAVIAFEYSERDRVAGAERPFFRNIRLLARPPEGIIEAGLFGAPPTVAAVNAILAGYPGTTPISGSGNYNGAIGINTDGTLYTTGAGTNCVQNYRGLAQGLLGLGITNSCRQITVALGNYFGIQVPLRKYNVFARASYEITDDISIYGQFNFMHSSAEDSTAAGSSGPGKYLIVPLNSPWVTGNPALQQLLASRTGTPAQLSRPLSITKLLTMSGLRRQTFEYDVYQAVLGIRGDIPGTRLSFDIYGSIGRSDFTNIQYNDTSKSALAAILNGTANYSGPGGTCAGFAWNPFGVNPLSPGCLEYATRDNHNFNTTNQRIVEATVTGPIITLPAGDLSFAVGAGYRENEFNYQPDNALVQGDTPSFDSSVAASGRQTVKEVFGELVVPIFRDQWFAHSLSLDLGFRQSWYNGFGSASTYRADLSYRPISSLLIRGGYQHAIRAPSLGELYAPTTTGSVNIGATPNAGDPCDSRSVFRAGSSAAQVQTLCVAQGVPSALYPTFVYSVDSVFGTSGGNPNLTPENANSYTVGAVWSPRLGSPLFRTFNLSVDYYNIKITDAIGTLALTSILPRCFNVDGVSNPTFSNSNVFCQQITRDQNSGAIINGREGALNLATYQTDGIDIQLDWGFGLEALGLPADAGGIRLNSVVTYTRSFKVSSLPGSALLDFAGSIGNSAVSPQIAHPTWKAITSFAYAAGPVELAFRWRYIDAMIHQDLVANPAATTPGVPAYNYFDLSMRVRVGEQFEFSAGINNLTDRGPPFVSGQPLTTDSATYDIIGRTFFAGARVRF
jgi:iron complex outermembrane receptor protein